MTPTSSIKVRSSDLAALKAEAQTIDMGAEGEPSMLVFVASLVSALRSPLLRSELMHIIQLENVRRQAEVSKQKQIGGAASQRKRAAAKKS